MDGILLVNKPQDMTSNDLVQIVRRKLHTSKVGHTGTLDPMATGLMVLTVGKATKILPFLSHFTKEYICTMKFGQRTDTLDATGDILEERAVNPVNEKQAEIALKSFLGKSQQIPPMYSAKKINGVKLYDLARQNIEVDREPITIEISDIALLRMDENSLQFRVCCSSGTYIRSLTQDIAARLDNIAVMTALERTKVDKYDLKDAWQLAQIAPEIAPLSIYEVLDLYPYIDPLDYTDVYNGKRLSLESDQERIMIVNHARREVIACYERKDDGYYYCKRGLW